MAIAVLKLGNKPVAFIIQKMRDIVTAMTGNAAYPTPVPALAQITTETDDLETKYQDALNGGTDKKALVRIALTTVKASAQTLTGYVQSASAGDETRILSAGFDVKRPRTPAGILAPPANVRSAFGNVAGEIILRWGGVKGKLVYKVQMKDTTTGAGFADFTYTGKNRLVVSGIVSDRMYEFRIACISASGIGDYSDITSHKAL